MSKDASVLLVDASPTILLLERTLLARRGWKLSSAATLEEARKQLDTEVPSLVLCSEKLSDGSGLDLCREVREKSETKKLPFVMVIGRHDSTIDEASRRAGANALLYKPLRGSEVDRTINELLGLVVRRWERRIFHTLVAIHAPDHSDSPPALLASVNITPEGIALEGEPAASPLMPGQRVKITFYVPNHHEPISGDSFVVWRQAVDGRTRVGLRFQRLVPGGIQRIAAWGGFAVNPGE